jgi:hypothetical protein
MNYTRLLMVARALRETTGSFDMCDFHACGTPLCALGHYSARTDLQNSFKLVGLGGLVPIDAKKFDESLNVMLGGTSQAILDHFEIDRDQAYELFGVSGCGHAVTREAAINYIEAFVERHRAGELAGSAVSLDRDTINRAGSIPCSPVLA